MLDMEERVARQQVVDRVLARMTPRQQQIVRMTLGTNGDAPLSQKETAAVLGVSAPRVWQVIQRFRAALAEFG